jgi:UDP-2,3-diacylglucosamine pyrophosphatase LpxH
VAADEGRVDPARTVVISDLHLGRPHGAARSAQALRPLWSGAARLIVNGDTAEIHHPEHWSVAARLTLELFDLCERDGVELILLSGNHDPYISDTRHLTAADGKVFITHGDVMHPAVAPWSPASARIRAAHERALAALEHTERDTLEARLRASQHASFAEWHDLDGLADEAAHSTTLGMLIRPWAVAQVLRYWMVFPRLAAAFLAEHAPESEYIVVGHTHRAGIWRIDGRTVINTGSFGFPGKPRAVVLEGARLTVHDVMREGEVYALRGAGAEFTL